MPLKLSLVYKLHKIGNNVLNMKKLTHNEQGFIPLLLTILAIIIAVIVFAYLRVVKAQR
jgi:hypothetical protein